MNLATRNLSVVIFLSVVGALLFILLITMLYLNRVACFNKCEGQTCCDVKKMIKQASHDIFTDSSSDEEETTPIKGKKDKKKGDTATGDTAKGDTKGDTAKEASPKDVEANKKEDL